MRDNTTITVSAKEFDKLYDILHKMEVGTLRGKLEIWLYCNDTRPVKLAE